MKKFALTSDCVELLLYVAQKLVFNEVSFTFVHNSSESYIESDDDESLDFYADGYRCDCDASAEYHILDC